METGIVVQHESLLMAVPEYHGIQDVSALNDGPVLMPKRRYLVVSRVRPATSPFCHARRPAADVSCTQPRGLSSAIFNNCVTDGFHFNIRMYVM